MNPRIPAVLESETKNYLKCPECSSRIGSVDHLKEGTRFGIWYCQSCGTAVSGTVLKTGIDIVVHDDERSTPSLTLLRTSHPLSTGDYVYIVVREVLFPGFNSPEHLSYWYNEHSCPTNYLGLQIFEGCNSDPHGLLQWVDTIKRPTTEEYQAMSEASSGIKGFDETDLSWDNLLALFPRLQVVLDLDDGIDVKPKLVGLGLTGE